MKQALTTAAIGSGLLVLIGLALGRRGPDVEGEVARRLSHSPMGPRTEHRLPEGLSSRESVAPKGRLSGVSRAWLRQSPGSVDPPFPSSEGFPDFESKRALRHDEQDFWEDLGALLELRPKIEPAQYRAKISAMTAEYLGFNSSQAAMFERTAARATQEIGRAWKVRNESIEALPGALDLEERERHERGIQEGYEAAKTEALGRLESLLESSPRHEYFRRRLGEWLDALR